MQNVIDSYARLTHSSIWSGTWRVHQSDNKIRFQCIEGGEDYEDYVVVKYRSVVATPFELAFSFTESQIETANKGIFELLQMTTQFLEWLSVNIPEFENFGRKYWVSGDKSATYEEIYESNKNKICCSYVWAHYLG